MKRRLLTIVLTLLLTMGLTALPVLAAGIGSGNTLCTDSANCVKSQEDIDALNSKLNALSQRQECEVVICTTNKFDGKTATQYADDYYDELGYGWGKDKSGILFLINPKTRDWAISTCGEGIPAFTDAGQEYIMEQLYPSLSEDDYLAAFDRFADLCDMFLTQAHEGEPYDTGNMPGEQKGIFLIFDIIVGLIIGIIFAFIMVGKDKSALKTVRKEPKAKSYQRQGSLEITKQSDKFLYKNVTKVKKSKSSSGGGSSTHRSSSGRIHGGSSGKF